MTQVISRLGEEHNARRIARAIVAARPGDADGAARRDRQDRARSRRRAFAIHPATRTFQALRIHVNDELGELERGLDASQNVLAPGGRLVVVAFHSLEDRIVKRFLSRRSTTAPRASRHAPATRREHDAAFQLLSHRPLTPDARETLSNPRARSARLRAANACQSRPRSTSWFVFSTPSASP